MLAVLVGCVVNTLAKGLCQDDVGLNPDKLARAVSGLESELLIPLPSGGLHK